MRYFRFRAWQGLVIVLGFGLAIAGCSTDEEQTTDPEDTGVVASKFPTRKGPAEIGTSDEGRKTSQANNRMAFELFSKIARKDQDTNFFMSPFSISHGIGMVLEGADGKTASQIRDALQIPKDVDSETYHRGIAYLYNQFQYKPNLSKEHRAIATLEKQLEELRAEARSISQNRNSWNQVHKLRRQEEALVEKLNEKRSLLDGTECLITNGIWTEKTYVFSKKFLDALAKHYGAESAYQADFKTQPDQERKRINDWVAKYTGSKIQNALAPGTVNELTRAALVNTIYFNGKWLEPFSKYATEDKDFHLDAKKVIQVPMMQKFFDVTSYAAFNADGSYFDTPTKILVPESELPPGTEGEKVPATEEAKIQAERPKYPEDGFQMVELPYRGNELSMIVIAPRSYDGLPRLEKLLTADRFREWTSHLQKRCVETHLPKFKLEKEYSLIEIFKSLGVTNAFTMPGDEFDPETQADFSKMLESGETDLYLTLVLHKTFLEVNEEGTEAAAATISLEEKKDCKKDYREVPFHPVFKADRPFLFFICDRKLKTILFMGRVARP